MNIVINAPTINKNKPPTTIAIIHKYFSNTIIIHDNKNESIVEMIKYTIFIALPLNKPNALNNTPTKEYVIIHVPYFATSCPNKEISGELYCKVMSQIKTFVTGSTNPLVQMNIRTASPKIDPNVFLIL